ncbi:MAG: tetratricopeptide repeat protein [Planctomycetota bacterium]|nr:tetratricopeptide repeat protein [Planctomycetota bacterium]
MASYLDKIPKQLAARRKAFAAARANPALLPSCWAIVRSIANNMYDYVRNSVVGGCTFPDRPIYLSTEDAAFINFGASPRLLTLDMLWLEAEAANQPPPDSSSPAEPSPENQVKIRRQLARLARTYSPTHETHRVYNLENWIQEMYRDKLDVDYAEHLQRQIDGLNVYMDAVPKSLQAAGLSGKLLKAVADSFNLFKTITGSSHQLDREKMSFSDRRGYVDTIQKIERVMVKADEALGTAGTGRSAVRELYGLWKNANYEMMGLTRELRALWAGTSLDDRIAELAELLGAVQKTINRCAEEARSPSPQLPVVRADEESRGVVSRADVAEVFQAVTLYEPITAGNAALVSRDIRRFGPLIALLTPGSGQPRYCSEIRKLGREDDDEAGKYGGSGKHQPKQEREIDVDRRVRYPMNCLVTPIGAERGTLVRDLSDAWLEYQQTAFPVAFQEFLEGAKEVVPQAFALPPDKTAKDMSVNSARQTLAKLIAAFSEWAHSGKEPVDEDAASVFPPFRDYVLARLGPPGFLIPLRHRPFLNLFSEAGAIRRLEMWKRCLGPRLALDRQLVAVNVIQKDWKALRDSLKYLPASLIRGNANLDNGFAKTKELADPFSEHKAAGFFRKFLEDQPDLKSALATVESQVAIEVETLRSQSEGLGRVFQFDQAASAIMRRQTSQLQEKRNAANAHIDQYLAGLMYALDNNYEAAEGALAMCLVPLDKREPAEPAEPPIPDEIGKEWFAAAFPPKDGNFQKRGAPGETASGIVCYDFIYYNLGVVYLKLNRHIEAMMCFQTVIKERPDGHFLYRQWAETLLAGAKANVPGGAA